MPEPGGDRSVNPPDQPREGDDGGRPRPKRAPVDCERPGRRRARCVGRTATARSISRRLMIDKAYRPGFLCNPQLRRLPRHGDPACCRCRGPVSPTTRGSKPMCFDIDEEELRGRRHSCRQGFPTGRSVGRKRRFACYYWKSPALLGRLLISGADARTKSSCRQRAGRPPTKCSPNAATSLQVPLPENASEQRGTADQLAGIPFSNSR